MPAESFSKILFMLASLFGFVCTIWAICIPTIRTHPGSQVWLARVAWTILFGLLLLILVSAAGNLIVSDGQTPAEPNIGAAIVAMVVGTVLWLTGYGLVWTLEEISRPK